MASLLKVFRTEIAQRRVLPAAIAARFHVEEKTSSHLLVRPVGTVMDSLALQGPEETWHRTVFIPAAGAVHAGLNPMSWQEALVLLISVLAALIGVMNEAKTGINQYHTSDRLYS